MLTPSNPSSYYSKAGAFYDAWQGRESSIKSKAVLTSQRIFSRIFPPCQALCASVYLSTFTGSLFGSSSDFDWKGFMRVLNRIEGVGTLSYETIIRLRLNYNDE